MRNLLNFLIKYNYWFLFLLLEVASFVLLFRFNRYQQSVFFTSANGMAGWIYELSGNITSYFHLKSVNEDLLDRNVWLEQRVAALEQALRDQAADTLRMQSLERVGMDSCQTFKAHVIKNTLSNADNYITLDQGSLAGIRPEMGVVDANGAVGIVYKTSPRYSLVISLLNSKSSLSCKIEMGRRQFAICLSERSAPACRVQSGRYGGHQRLFYRIPGWSDGGHCGRHERFARWPFLPAEDQAGYRFWQDKQCPCHLSCGTG